MIYPMESRPIKTITINGQTYNSVEDMPPKVREQYDRAMAMLPDENHNGVPDILEQPAAGKEGAVVSHITQSSKFIINGQEYNSLEDVPPQFRQMIAATTSTMSATSSDAESHPPAFRALATLQTENGKPGGITIRLTWPMIAALIVTLLLAAMFAMWWTSR